MFNRDWLDSTSNEEYAAFLRDCMSFEFCEKYCPRVDCCVETLMNDEAFESLCLKNILIWLGLERGHE